MLNPASNLADSELVCNCNSVTKRTIVKAIHEKGFTSREEVAVFTRASTGCGSCAQLVEDLVSMHRPKQMDSQGTAVGQQGAPDQFHFEPRQYPKNLDVGRIKKEGLELDFSRIRELGVRGLSDDDYYRLKTYGICSQKHPEYFMMRIRIPGGRVTADQLDCLAELAKYYGRSWGHLTTRQDMELHWVRLEKVQEIWEQLEAVGLTSRSACGHTLRNVMACPHSAISPTSATDVRPWAKAISDYFVSRSAWINPAMPNRLNIFFAGCADCAAYAPVNDIGWVAVNDPAGGNEKPSLGFQLWVGGSLGSYPVLGFQLKSFLRPEEVLPACQAIFQLHMQHGGRQKGKTRLKFLIEELGRERFQKLFEETFANKKTLPENRLFPMKLPTAPRYRVATPISLGERLAAFHQKELPPGWKTQRQSGYTWSVLEIPLGEIRWKQLAAVSQLARQYRGMEVYFNMDQNVELHWIRKGQIPQIQKTLEKAELTIKGLQEGPRVVACPGTQFCVLAVTNSQGAARDLRNQIVPRNTGEKELLDGLTIHISGCPNSCARHQIADIGLAGGMAPLGDHRRYSYQLYLGGGLEGEPRLGAVIRKGLTEEVVVPAVQALVEMAGERKQPGESFREWVRRLGPGEISRLLDVKLAPQLPQKVERILMSPELVEVG
ncbi:MAG: (2Fe-2S)-binding protein [Acidobacteria bacterium]|nr:(2Fe-2S)-binding protein [Acidobacteriota bacterium]